MTTKYHFIIFYILSLILACSQVLHGQKNKFVFDHVTSEGKEYLNSVRAVYQDQYGYIWMGLNTAIVRYDGYEFKTFKGDINDSTSFLGRYTNTFTEDINGDLWIGTKLSGLYHFKRDTETFIQYVHRPSDTLSLSHNNIITLFHDSNGFIWCVSDPENGYLDRINPRTKKIDRFSTEKDINKVQINFGRVNLDLNDSTATLTEGKDGSIWYPLKDGNGLCRYDFKNDSIIRYSHQKDNPHSLKSDTVYTVISDNDQNIWIGTSQGLNKYNWETDNFDYFPEIHTAEDPEQKSIFKMYKDSRGMLWLTMYNDLIQFNPVAHTFKTQNISLNNINIIGEVPKKGIWIDPGNFTYRFYDFNQEKITTVQNILLNQSIYEIDKPFAPVSSYMVDNSGLLWIAIYLRGIYKEDDFIRTFDLYSPEFEYSEGLTNTPLYTVCEDPQGKIWLTSNRGLFYFDPSVNSFYLIGLNEPLGKIISEDNGKLWISTESVIGMGSHNGLFTLDSKSFNEANVNLAMNKVAISSSIEGIGQNPAYATDGDKTTRWASAWSDPEWIYIDLEEPVNIGRIVLHWEFASAKDYVIQSSMDAINWRTVYSRENRTKTGGTDDISLETFGRYIKILGSERASDYGYSLWEIEIYKPPIFNHIRYQNGNKYRLPSEIINGLQKDSQDNIWLISPKGLSIFDKIDQKFRTFAFPESTDSGVSEFHEDKRGLIWLIPGQPSNNITNFNPVSKEFSSFEFPDSDAPGDDGLTQNVKFYEDFKNRFWVIGNDIDNSSYKIYLLEAGGTLQLKYSSLWNITGILHEKENLFWISLFARGLQLINLESGEVLKTFDNTNGFDNLEINSIKKYSSKNIWIQYRDGLGKFNPESESYHSYNSKYGIQDIIYTNTLESKNGHIFIPGMNGFNVFHPDSLLINSIPPNVVISSFKIRGEKIDMVNNNSTLNKQIATTGQINLTSTQNVFTIGFTGLHYGLSEGNIYAVKLEGIDSEWNNTGTEREVTYTGLSPGNYKFQVKSANAGGFWNESPATLLVIIHPPWYISWWSISFFVLSITGLIFTFYRWRSSIHKEHLDKKQKEIDEQKHLNERLKQVDQLKDQFLANTSHELRTPLIGIIGLADSLRDGIAGKQSSKATGILNMITGSGKRLSNLINDILDFSKLKNNELQLHLGPVDVYSAVDIVIRILHPLIKDKALRLINDIPHDIPLVYADENRFQQILINLIGNAIKFTDEGSIVISSEERSDSVYISISDTGIGIPKEKHVAIFRSFEQADMSNSREYGGTGIGLAITKQLVELHGGTIQVDSKEGQGSKFTFSLPSNEVIEKDQPEEDKRAHATFVFGGEDFVNRPIPNSEEIEVAPIEKDLLTGGEQMRILIVDDEPVNLEVLFNYLSIAGYSITRAKNGIEALELLKSKERFDLVILDVMMPKMSGYEMCNKLREIFQPNELPVIMLTVKNTVADLVSGLNCGANDYLTKPFTKEELLSRVKTHLNLHRINKVTNRFVPIKFLQAIGKNSIMDVRLGDHANLNVTVFFSDIRNYTTMSESMTPEENFKFIHAYVKRMGPIIHKHSGFINQYMGDAIMAIFPEQTHQALDAAVDMQNKIFEYNNERIKKGKVPIKVGMGLHGGPLTMGIIGDENRSEPSTIADTVNIAARIEQLTKYYGARILLSEESFNYLPEAHRYHIRYLGNVRVKGIKDSLKVFECFDGDDADSIKLKMETLIDFEIGLKQFYLMDFPEAAVTFKKILKINNGDQVVHNFYNQSVKFSHEGVPENWSGAELTSSPM